MDNTGSSGNNKDIRKSILNRIAQTELLVIDFSLLMYIRTQKLLDWIAEFATDNQMKVLVCDEFFKCYELVQESESKEQREIAICANNLINKLSRNGALVQDEKLESMEKIIQKVAGWSNVTIFMAKDSEADEYLRASNNPKALIFACLADGRFCCESAEDYLKINRRSVADKEDDNLQVQIPKYPKKGDTVRTKDKKNFTLLSTINTGAEGTVYLTDNPLYVCKIYHESALTLNKIKKLKLQEERQVRYDGICWPEKRVFTQDGYPVGFIMKRAYGHSLSEIFDGADSVLEKFPNWKRVNLVCTVISILKKIQYLHLLGIIVGDIRPQNIMIDDNGKTYLIDMDSCQIEKFPSPVGDEDYTPAENQGRAFSSFLRTYRNERFSCLVLAFFVLFVGQHPYAQRNGADTIREEISDRAFRYPRKNSGDCSLIPYGEYTQIWLNTPGILKDVFYDAFKNDIRLSLFNALELFEEYRDFLGTLRANDSRFLLKCEKKTEYIDISSGICDKVDDAEESTIKGECLISTQGKKNKSKKLTSKRKFKVSELFFVLFCILIFLLVAFYISAIIDLLISEERLPQFWEPIERIMKWFKL